MDDLATDTLKDLSAQQFSSLLATAFGILVDPRKADGVEGKLPSGSSLIHLTAILLLARDANRKNLTGEKLTEQLKKNGLSEEQALRFTDQWNPKAWSLSPKLGYQGVTTNRLVDMEWRFGVSAGSSEVKQAGNLFLQLKLVVKKGGKVENVYMELTMPQFYNFLHEMERARALLSNLQ
uniref:COMM domain-containing protein 7 n=1 Tax=Myxine glutinosa TaxID=7769 RepID=UPI00358EDF5B